MISPSVGISCFTNWEAHILIDSAAITQYIVSPKNYGQVYAIYGIELNPLKIPVAHRINRLANSNW